MPPNSRISFSPSLGGTSATTVANDPRSLGRPGPANDSGAQLQGADRPAAADGLVEVPLDAQRPSLAHVGLRGSECPAVSDSIDGDIRCLDVVSGELPSEDLALAVLEKPVELLLEILEGAALSCRPGLSLGDELAQVQEGGGFQGGRVEVVFHAGILSSEDKEDFELRPFTKGSAHFIEKVGGEPDRWSGSLPSQAESSDEDLSRNRPSVIVSPGVTIKCGMPTRGRFTKKRGRVELVKE